MCHDRIANIIGECKADVVAVQELDAGRARSKFVDQPREIAERLGMDVLFYSCDGWRDGRYGTALFSRHPIELVRSANLPGMHRREPRGAVWAQVEAHGQRVNVVNTHLGLHPLERLAQVEALLGPEWVGHEDCSHPTVVCGDFNLSRFDRSYDLLTKRLRDTQFVARAKRPLPTWLGLRTIDFILVNDHLDVHHVDTHRPLRARLASDHVPLVARLGLKRKSGGGAVAA